MGPAGSSRYRRVGPTWAPGPFGVWVANRAAINSLPLGAQEEACAVTIVIYGKENNSYGGNNNNEKENMPGYLKIAQFDLKGWSQFKSDFPLSGSDERKVDETKKRAIFRNTEYSKGKKKIIAGYYGAKT